MPRTSLFEAKALKQFLLLTGLHAEPRSDDTSAGASVFTDGGDRHPVPIVVRRVAAPTRYLIESAIVHAAAEQRLSGPCIILISVTKLAPKMLDRIEALLASTVVNAAVVSDAGGAWIRLPHFGISTQVNDQTARMAVREDKERRFDFPDAAAWIIKSLLLAKLKDHPRWWGGYRGLIRTGSELAERAGVSPSMVSHVFERLRSRSFLRTERSDEIAISRPRALLELWMSQARHRIPRSISVRPLYGNVPKLTGDILDWLANKWLHSDGAADWAVNGWMACHLHETGFVTDLASRRVSIVGLGDHQSLISAWGLMRCDERDAMLTIQPASAPRSIKGGIFVDKLPGSGPVARSLPVVDIIQAAVDVAHDPARGFEQAEHICRLLVEGLDE
jgi:hypothetical protein